MNTYEQVKKIVESGKIAICSSEQSGQILFSSYMSDGRIRGSLSTRPNKIDWIIDSLGKVEYTRSEINSLTYEGVLVRPLWRPKVGDNVRVLKTIQSVKTYNGFPEQKKKILDGVLEVTELLPSGCKVKGPGCSPFWMSYEHLIPDVMIKERSEKIYVYGPDGKKIFTSSCGLILFTLQYSIMKKSDLIKLLNEVPEEFGDIEVVLDNTDYVEGMVTVESWEVTTDGSYLILSGFELQSGEVLIEGEIKEISIT